MGDNFWQALENIKPGHGYIGTKHQINEKKFYFENDGFNELMMIENGVIKYPEITYNEMMNEIWEFRGWEWSPQDEMIYWALRLGKQYKTLSGYCSESILERAKELGVE